MERLEVILWVSVLRRASKGDVEAQEMLKEEDEARKENGLPTVREELKAMLEKKE